MQRAFLYNQNDELETYQGEDEINLRSGGIFITFEGIEGSGKTTQMTALGSYLQERGFPAKQTREPGGTPIGDAIRVILLSPERTEMSPLADLLLYGASRSQHTQEVIRPAIAQGKIILCDRFSDATLAYQGYGRGLELSVVRQVDAMVTGGLNPALTILLDCPVEMGLERSWNRLRIEGKTSQESRFEKETRAFHQRVRDGYLEIARQAPERVKVVDASGSMASTQAEIRRRVLPVVEETRGHLS